MSDVIPAAALERYEAAQQRAVDARKAWEDDGAHFTIEYVNGLEGVHPLLKVLMDAEKHADMLMKSLSQRAMKAGRPVGAQSAPDRQETPRLRAVK